MTRIAGIKTATLATAATLVAALALPAHAVTKVVEFNVLNATAMLPTPFASGDTLLLDTTVTQETGPLSQSITFTLGAGVTALTGRAAWEISTATGPGPRLVGVNIDIFDAGNNLVLSDAFAGVLAGFAVSTFDGPIGPGTYRLVATGNAVRDTVLDVSITAVPEPGIYSLLLAGLGVVCVRARRRHLG
ncbi:MULTISPECIES: PEP-CTERM sorting domain-containing protein [unclassified Roseateles]|uniref:PEP-CTERM sorting domain-containing protein n=1 Tax=unclassified Roseateles TaxID=2626991 RepID=UPI000A9DDB83|nr:MULTISPECIES: PEP-CTERM sorting domain-containing protein [unclassified Roseateles]